MIFIAIAYYGAQISEHMDLTPEGFLICRDIPINRTGDQQYLARELQLDKPLDLETVLPGTFAGLYILDRWCGITPDGELVSDLCDPDFGLPAYYTINGEGNCIAARVHHSRLVRFVGRELPYLERIAEMYWGESEVEALYSDVVKHDNVSANMAALTFRANTDIMEVQNLDQLFSVTSGEMQKRFWNTMQAQSVMKSNFGMQLVNKGDQMHNTQYTFSGLQEVYDSMCLDLAGASRIPVTKLFGRSPAGMNATGESDLRNYYDYVDTLRESQLRPVLEKLLPVLAMSAWGEIPEGLEISFPPLWTPTAKEVSEIAKAKTETVVAAFQAGLVDQSAAQKELKKLAEETGLFDSITEQEIEANVGKSYRDVTALQDPLLGLGYETPQEEAGEEASPFEQSTGDSLALDYNKNHDPSNGRFTSGSGGLSSGEGLTNAIGQPILEVKKSSVKGPPNGITQKVNAKGGIDRNYYGPDGRQTKQISNNGHGHKKEEAIGLHGEHAHDYKWDEEGKSYHLDARELTATERRENSDII